MRGQAIVEVVMNGIRRRVLPCLRKARDLFHARWRRPLLVLALSGLPLTGFSQAPCVAGIHVNILGIRNSKGSVDCALFDSPGGFPNKALTSAINLMAMKVRDTKARCDFESIPVGTYAIVVFHDENMNGKLDTNWIGIPKEGYGFSSNERGGGGSRTFADASFKYDGKSLDFTIKLNY